ARTSYLSGAWACKAARSTAMIPSGCSFQCVAFRDFFRAIELTQWRLWNEQQQKRQQHSWRSADVKERAPSILRPHDSAQQVAERRTNRNRQIEDAHHASAFFF